MTYICLEPNCKSVKRLGCAHCFLEDHSSHKKMKIEDMQLKWSEICEQTAYMNYGTKNLYAKVQGQSINIVEKITNECNEIKKWFGKMVDTLKDKLFLDFDNELSKFHMKKE